MIVEKLTQYHENYGYVCNVAECYFSENGKQFTCELDEDNCFTCCHMWNMVEKLGEYEDSGLDPKTVQKVAEFMKLFPQLSEKYLKGE